MLVTDPLVPDIRNQQNKRFIRISSRQTSPQLQHRPAPDPRAAQRPAQPQPPPAREARRLHGRRHEGQRAPLPRHAARGLPEGTQPHRQAPQGVSAGVTERRTYDSIEAKDKY